MIGAPQAGSGGGVALVFKLPLTTGTEADAAFTITGAASEGSGAALASNGDVDGDGLADLLVSGVGGDISLFSSSTSFGSTTSMAAFQGYTGGAAPGSSATSMVMAARTS